MFAYALAQNIGNPNASNINLSVPPSQIFGNPTLFNPSLCGGSLGDQNYKHKSLPHGRDLQSKDLQKDLVVLFDSLANDAEKVAPHGSSPANESLNNKGCVVVVGI